MDGIESITAKILDDARQQIADINAQAAQKVEQLQEQYAQRAQRESEAILEEGRAVASQRKERLVSGAGLERRKMELAAKQQVLDEAFELALDKLCSLPEEEYVAVLAAMAVRAAPTGQEQLIFSAADRARVGKRVVMAANEALVRKEVPKLPESLGNTKVGAFLDRVVQNAAALITGNGQLTLSEQTRPIRGGFIMSDGSVETNCAFETLVRMERQRLERQVADILFN